MGRRSRRRAGDATDAPAPAQESGRSTRAERDAQRRNRGAERTGAGAARRGDPQRRALTGRRPTDQRPPAPWGALPLTEVVLGLALLFVIAGVLVGGQRGFTMVLAGFALGALAGLELILREHMAGYRSHSTLLALAAATPVLTAVFLLGGRSEGSYGLGLAAGAGVFMAVFLAARRTFRRRSGGLTFR